MNLRQTQFEQLRADDPNLRKIAAVGIIDSLVPGQDDFKKSLRSLAELLKCEDQYGVLKDMEGRLLRRSTMHPDPRLYRLLDICSRKVARLREARRKRDMRYNDPVRYFVGEIKEVRIDRSSVRYKAALEEAWFKYPDDPEMREIVILDAFTEPHCA